MARQLGLYFNFKIVTCSVSSVQSLQLTRHLHCAVQLPVIAIDYQPLTACTVSSPLSPCSALFSTRSATPSASSITFPRWWPTWPQQLQLTLWHCDSSRVSPYLFPLLLCLIVVNSSIGLAGCSKQPFPAIESIYRLCSHCHCRCRRCCRTPSSTSNLVVLVSQQQNVISQTAVWYLFGN